jgi:8-oxo-dGTP pyrophosphatase MutT (NUDIX family)
MENKVLHEVVITAIVYSDDQYLITKRSEDEDRFPGMWTVPGGKLETDDYTSLEKDTDIHWYNVLEQVLEREVKEEAGIDIDKVEYVTSLSMVHDDGAPSLIISCMAEHAGGEISLDEEEMSDHAWVTVEEAEEYDLISGIYDELVMADKQRAGEASKF